MSQEDTQPKESPKVLNKYKLMPGDSGIFILRGTPYGNMFVIGKDGDRDAICDKFRDWAYAPEQSEFRQLVKRELKGENVICVCAQPNKHVRCHGDTVIKIANED